MDNPVVVFVVLLIAIVFMAAFLFVTLAFPV